MSQPHISVIDWAFRVFMQNYTNVDECRCKIGKIKVGSKEINPDMFKKQMKEEVWQ